MKDHDRAVALPQLISSRQCQSTDVVMQVVWYIMENLHVDLSVSVLAKRFSLEESILPHAFEAHNGIALDQFVLRRRIERALHLLKHSNATDSEIAIRVGWGSAPAFQAAFSSHLGVSPTEYRRSLLPAQQPTNTHRRPRRPCKLALIPREESTGRASHTFAV